MKVQAIQILDKYKIHPSVQRIAIMDYLLTHRTHPTVDEVYQALSSSIPTLSKTTVYNTLHLFYESGAVQMLTIDETKLRFDGDVSPHVHFLCKQCGTVYDFPYSDDNKVAMTDETERFQIEEKHLYLKGICANCKNKNM